MVLWYFLRKPFLATDPEIFLKAPWVGARAKKTQFFCQHFPKNAQKRLFCTCFFKTCLPAKLGLFTALEDFEKSIWSTQEKVVKIFENFLKIRPPRENSRSAPVGEVLMILPAF